MKSLYEKIFLSLFQIVDFNEPINSIIFLRAIYDFIYEVTDLNNMIIVKLFKII